MVRELKKELAEANERLRILKEIETKNPKQRRENTGDQELMRKIIRMLQVRLGIQPSKRYKTREK